jgi:hypothetical protein
MAWKPVSKANVSFQKFDAQFVMSRRRTKSATAELDSGKKQTGDLRQGESGIGEELTTRGIKPSSADQAAHLRGPPIIVEVVENIVE